MWVARVLTASMLFAGAMDAQPIPSPAAPTAQAEENPVVPQPEAPVLLNTGKPMLVEYQCTDEDIQTAGLGCTREDPCPMYLELASVESVGNRIFLAGNLHSPTTTVYSVLLASSDDGKTWREPHERIRSAVLDKIQFVDFENGWVAGEVMHPLPRDPFLLITSDGGKNWREAAIFGEPRFGSILQYWFSSKTSGSLVVDQGQPGNEGRYGFYGTTDGGETWTLHESSERPLKLRGVAGVSNEDWRIRADAPTKAFHIEHHAAEKWHGVARFSVSIGACRPPENPTPAETPAGHR